MFRKFTVIAVVALAIFAARASIAADLFPIGEDNYAITIRVENGTYEFRFFGYINSGFNFQNDLDTYDDECPDCYEYGDDRIVVFKRVGLGMPIVFGTDCRPPEGVFEDDDGLPFQCESESFFDATATYESLLETWSEDVVFNILFDSVGPGYTDYMDGQQLLLNGDAHDSDKDGIHDDFDACPDVWDSELDSDGDGIDDACDVCPSDDTNTCPEYGTGGVVSDADDDAGEDDGDDDAVPDFGDWLSDTEGPSNSSNVSEGGCSLISGQPAGFTAYIMIALALIPVAIRRRK